MSEPPDNLPSIGVVFPTAGWFLRYGGQITNGAERMFALYEEQARTRMRLEIMVLEGEHRRATQGLFAGVLVALAVLGAATYCASINQPWVAGVLGGLDIVALVGIFVYGTERRRSERLARVGNTASQACGRRTGRSSEAPGPPGEPPST